MWVAGTERWAKSKGRSAIVGPGHLVDTGVALHRLHSHPLPELSGSQVGNELPYCKQENLLLLPREPIEVAQELIEFVMRRHCESAFVLATR